MGQAAARQRGEGRVKRARDLWPSLVSWSNLLKAARQAQRGKRQRGNVVRFNLDREWELLRLEAELGSASYLPGRYCVFWINDAKPRMISAAPYRDRVVHHALCNVIEPIFDRGFIYDTYACRKGKGTHAAVDRFTHYARRYRYVLQCDVRKYFPSIDHDILFDAVQRRIKDKRVLALVRVIIDESPAQPTVRDYFPGDDLFTPSERRRGLPIGNLTSQLLSNVYLDSLDHYVKETWRCPGYVRYCDDFVCFANEKRYLWDLKSAIDAHVAGLRLRLHRHKCAVRPVQAGTPFLGYVVYPYHRRLRRGNGVRFMRRVSRLQHQFARGQIGVEAVRASVQAWTAHASHADTHGLRRSLLSHITFSRAQARSCARRRVEQHA